MNPVVLPAQIYVDQIDWTSDQYHRMIEAGILTEDDKVELILGKIIPMSPVGGLHAASVSALEETFIPKLVGRYTCRSENPIILPDHTEPEPDFVIARHRPDRYAGGHPQAEDILLIIEVADQTLQKDRKLKTYIYASAGIPEYWILNLIDRQLEQYLHPQPSGVYDQRKIYREKDVISHKIIGELPISSLLPILS